MWMIEAIVLLGIFCWGFAALIRRDGGRFEKTKWPARVFAGITAICLLALLIDSGFGGLFAFFLVFCVLTGASYYLYLKRSKKLGFIGLSFCMTFSVLFAYMHFVLLNFG